ncbi:MAG TPA: DUF3592 domain-containing protein [Anaerolineales bacterium]|nr:DUF3592 domain-containing protein [Anaerolineales bacterium]
MQDRSLSLFRVISTDYSSYLSILFPVVFGVFGTYFFFAGNDSFRLFLPLAIGVTVVGVPVLIWRYRTIASVFADGQQTKGVITGIGFFRGRGVVKYSYTFKGTTQISDNAINRNGRTRKLRVGQKVTVLVDPKNPKRAFIQELYL